VHREVSQLGRGFSVSPHQLRSSGRYDALMDTGYEWPSLVEKASWEAAGRALLEPLREELGQGYDVQYFDGGSQGSASQ